MDILLPYGLILFGATGVVSALCALFASLLGLGAAADIWNLAKACGYLFVGDVVILFIYHAYLDDLEQQERAKRKRRARKRRR